MKFTYTININTARFVSAENTQGPVQFSYFCRPQTKFAKVMFSQVSVCQRRGGVCLWFRGATAPWADTPRQTPPLGRHPPADTSPGRPPPAQHMLGYTPLPSACRDTHTPLPSACWDTPPSL